MQKGTVYFFTGLAGAGKTTLGSLFYQHLKEKKSNVILFDGDSLRKESGDRDYSYEGRLRGAWGLFERCRQTAEQGTDVVCCSISMYTAIREWNRKNIDNYREIYIRVKKETLYQRDQKGLYSSGEKNVVGIDIPAEEPECPDIVVQNDGEETPEEIVAQIEKKFGLGG